MTTSGGTTGTRAGLAWAIRTGWFVSIGRTTAWPDDTTPPDWDTTHTALSDVVLYQRVGSIRAVYPDAGGSIIVQGQHYSQAPTAETAAVLGARYLLLIATIPIDAPTCTFRQAGLWLNQHMLQGVDPNAAWLLPGQVASPGCLMAGQNFSPIVRVAGSQQILTFLVEV